jgi:hypothetical protein
MSEKENKQQVNQPPEAIEDLTVNEAEAEDVKGGSSYLKFKDIDGVIPPERSNSGAGTAYNPFVTVDSLEEIPK